MGEVIQLSERRPTDLFADAKSPKHCRMYSAIFVPTGTGEYMVTFPGLGSESYTPLMFVKIGKHLGARFYKYMYQQLKYALKLRESRGLPLPEQQQRKSPEGGLHLTVSIL